MKTKLLSFKNKSGKWFWIMLVTLVAGIVWLLFSWSKNNKVISTAKVSRGLIKEELVLTGSVNAVKYASLSFPTSGKVAWVGVTEGQKVYKGQALTSLDTTTLNTAYQETLNTYKKYQATAENVLDQVKNHSSDETFAQKDTRTTAEVNRDNAYDAVKAAKYNIDNSTIYAPFNGVISSLPFTSPSVNVSLADTQVIVVDPTTVYFDVDADQNDVTSLNVGQDAVVILDSYQGKEITGKVTFISITPKVGVSGTNYKVKVEFNNPNFSEIFPRIGMTGDAKFTLKQKDNVLFVPSEFVKSDIKGKYIKVGGPNNKTYIETGLQGEERIEVLGDKIKDGDTVYD